MSEEQMFTDVDRKKQQVRERVWDALDAGGAVEDDTAHGRIPNFKGSKEAAVRLGELPAWKHARVIKAVPDKAQLLVRAQALSEGKTVFMAVPKLADPHPFYLLDPSALSIPPTEAASSRVAASVAPKVGVDALRPVDMVVLGSVAVNRSGVRIGKGAGYSDLEFAFLTEAGLIGEHTVVVTTVHGLQVLDEELPATAHDVGVDVIVTPEEVITCPSPHRPSGLVWEHLDAQKIASIPLLAARALGY
ncbi:5-formyltetrahydrofolate cyclo-ligase [Streptantibioticus ferralitis]|uniref:5-formyltetrahydrofolate cyclo-ligase n=1 Tax=Streptantibioticus ferralitis TaxID=236510 RepID=A0ABT5Z0F3_9ACTN|nr:5-formyltetrahydrofolate cyclo-ligase [Streptantibioticus ferralitis]MDF2257316.1 5-formyltetrahydrofolate cyclo-ligase [Streptantibioticus ferralitis]